MTEAERQPLIDVIVPVHGAGPVFRRCAASLIAHADAFAADAIDGHGSGLAADATRDADVAREAVAREAVTREAVTRSARYRLVIVLDGRPDAETVLAVEELRAAAARASGGFELQVLTHETPLGFVLSANHALRGSDRDAVLLNSDTQVTAGWLGRLRAAAHSDRKIATVTPFSNNATICSVPRFLDENAIPAGHSVDSFGALVTRVSRREYLRLPTGVGFCLYVKRSVLDEIGPFDEAFGLGYGEEVDFCLRAASRGYVHVLDDATFIFHEGSRSFGRRREERMRRGERLVLSRHPDYLRNVADFIKQDPIAPLRARVLDELRRTNADADATTRGPRLPAAVPGVTASDVPMAGAENVAHPREADASVHAGAETASDGKLLDAAACVAATDVVPAGAEGAAPLPTKIQALSHGERVWVRGLLPFTADSPQRVLHVVPGWPPWASGDAVMAMRELVRDQSERCEVFVFARMTDPDRSDGSAVEYVDGRVRVRLIVASGSRRDVLSRIGVRSDPVSEDFARFVGEVRPQLVYVHDLDGQPLDLIEAARIRAIRAALKNVEAFVMGSQSLADRYAAARVLPLSARVYVLPLS